MSNVVLQAMALFKCSVSYEKYHLYRCVRHDGGYTTNPEILHPRRSGSVQRRLSIKAQQPAISCVPKEFRTCTAFTVNRPVSSRQLHLHC
jgi:hypothetical protein